MVPCPEAAVPVPRDAGPGGRVPARSVL